MSKQFSEGLTVGFLQNIFSDTFRKHVIDSIGDTGGINCLIVFCSRAQWESLLHVIGSWLRLLKAILSYVNRH
jgi:hypothetical protein